MDKGIETFHDIVIVLVEETLQISRKDHGFPVNG